MTNVSFLFEGSVPAGFVVSGHSTKNAKDIAGKTVCAAVSSAAYFAANTIIEVIKDRCLADVSDAKMSIKLKNPSEKSVAVLEGFILHITELAKQYPERIRIITEV